MKDLFTGDPMGYKGFSCGYKGFSNGYKDFSCGYKGFSCGYKSFSDGYKGFSCGYAEEHPPLPSLRPPSLPLRARKKKNDIYNRNVKNKKNT
ncbi:MAG: hypothetical protein LBE13_10215 [Bacteroidales bacterium]|nr:hypothetical protein [Bacteroidales bacterium]